jgi:hypothetical protein
VDRRVRRSESRDLQFTWSLPLPTATHHLYRRTTRPTFSLRGGDLSRYSMKMACRQLASMDKRCQEAISFVGLRKVFV